MNVYYLRYLGPKETGFGEIIAAVSSEDMTLAKWREQEPKRFEGLGTYTLMVSTSDVVTVVPEKEKKNDRNTTP